MTTPDLLCLKCPQFCGEFCSEGFGALKANMLGKKGMIHQSLYKDFQKLLFLHLGGLFHKLTLAFRKVELRKINLFKTRKMDFYECWCTSESTNMFISNGHLFWVQKYQSTKAIPRNDQAMRVQISESFFCWDFYSQIFTSGFLLPPWSSKFNAFQLGCHLHKNPTSYITSSSFEAAAHFVCIFQPGDFTPGGTTRNPKSYLLWPFETPKGGFYQKQRHLQYVGHRCERWP